MTWRIEWDGRASREFRKLDKRIQHEILNYLREHVIVRNNPEAFDKPLVGQLSGLWRYRVRDYRVVCKINKDKLTVLITRVAHRRRVYDAES